MKIRKLTDHIGAEVTGIDLRAAVDDATRRALNKAVTEHVALVIRDQQLTPGQFLHAGMLFGEPMDPNDVEQSIPGVPFVHEVSSHQRKQDGSLKKFGPTWHTDHTHEEYPPKHTALYAVELPRRGGGTSILNMRAGYEALPDDIKSRIDPMRTVNVVFGSAVKHYEDSDRRQYRSGKDLDPIIHPLVRTNPDTGGRALFFHRKKVENIVGMSPEDSQSLLDELLERALRPEFVYSHQWRLGDILIWDNRSALHRANYDYDPLDTSQHRLLYRLLIKGERPH